MIYSNAAANITILNAQKYNLKLKLNAAQQMVESVEHLAAEKERAEEKEVAKQIKRLEKMELKSADAIEDLRAHRVAQAFVADLTERMHIEKIRREKAAAFGPRDGVGTYP